MDMPLRVAGSVARVLGVVGLVAAMLGGCQVEKREVGPAAPTTPPTSPGDARARHFETNRYEMSEGGRMFRWFGCGDCHTDPAPGYLDLADAAWRRGGSLAQIYDAIAGGAEGMPAYAGRITPQQTWQIAGYVHGLQDVKPAQRRRNADALKGEPSAAAWQGPIP